MVAHTGFITAARRVVPRAFLAKSETGTD